MLQLILDILTLVFMVFGLFFMLVGAIGIVRLPDVYNRMHAATKSVTLGITGLLIAAFFALVQHPDVSAIGILASITLVIIFQFVANPVGAHILSKACHLDRAGTWDQTLSDELEEDRDRTDEPKFAKDPPDAR